MTITIMTEAMLPQVLALEEQCFSVPWSAQSFLSELRNPACRWFAALEGERVLGYAGMQTVLDEGYIGNIAVDPLQRRKGIASALLDALLREAEALSLAFLTLEVREHNEPAIRLYERSGFVPVGRRKAYYSHPTEDALLMTYYLRKEETP